jgi:hypothetical protein
LVGKPGTAFWVYDPKTSRYYEDEDGKDFTSTPFSSEYMGGDGSNSEIKGYEASSEEWNDFREKVEDDDQKDASEKEQKEEDVLKELGINVPSSISEETTEVKNDNLNAEDEINGILYGGESPDYKPDTEEDDIMPF